jgi:lipoteichoic acid synthase
MWSFCNVVYARFFFQYISVSAIGESGNLLDPFIFKCLIDGWRWTDIYYLGSFFLACYLYNKTSDKKLSMSELKCGLFVGVALFVIDVTAHDFYCSSSPSMRYFSYVKHRISLELLSQKCYSAQPVYANFQRGSLRSLGYSVIESLSGTMDLTDIQKRKLIKEMKVLKSVQECAESHPNIRNVIFVVVESYMSFTVNMKVRGMEVTPFLNSLYRDSTVYYNGQMNPNITLGESSDGQFIYMTGLLSLRSEITVTKAKKHSYPALPRQLAMAKNMHTYMVIPTAPSMWSQDVMCERYGIEKLYSSSDYNKAHSMYLSDDQIVDLVDSVNQISKQPFFSMVLTFSMHQPYVNRIDSTFSVYEEGYLASLNNYLNACHFTDRQLRIFFDRLKRRGLYDQSLIIIASDHHVGSSALELPDSMEDRKLPLFIINGGDAMKNAWTGECNQLDVYTTMMDLMDIKSNWRGLGYSLVSPAYKGSLTEKNGIYQNGLLKVGISIIMKNELVRYIHNANCVVICYYMQALLVC